ncbi:MAG TPA: phosphoglucomutase/phosphomannomutase family protein [Patescibacteria group bacterium]|nr:phosphoglucomutase/phosphomannomutase family protein [Patescibacteria group bacterium]
MIKFGTDGWRGIIGKDYTFNNVRLVSEGIANYIIERGEADKGIVIGYDARCLSGKYAGECAAVLASKGVKVWLADRIMPTPALTWQVKDRAAAGGVMITASHNPAKYNGLKFKASYGGSASSEIMAEIATYVKALEESGRKFRKAGETPPIEYFSPQTSYLEHVKPMLDKKTVAGYKGKIIFDVMHGAAMSYPRELAKEYQLNLVEMHSKNDPSFGGVNPEPIEKNLTALRQVVIEQKADIGLATDGDGDRIGAIDADGRFINPHQIMALLTKYFVEKRGWTGAVAQTLTVSDLVKRVAEKYQLKHYETLVGFKYITTLMLGEDILIGGEESGGIGLKEYIPERDGLLLGFLLIEMVAAYGKTLGQLIDEMMNELGWFYYERVDLHLDTDKKDRLMQTLASGSPPELSKWGILSYNRLDGCKLMLKDGWVMFRASGTEPIVRIYAEANKPGRLREMMTQAVDYANAV